MKAGVDATKRTELMNAWSVAQEPLQHKCDRGGDEIPAQSDEKGLEEDGKRGCLLSHGIPQYSLRQLKYHEEIHQNSTRCRMEKDELAVGRIMCSQPVHTPVPTHPASDRSNRIIRP